MDFTKRVLKYFKSNSFSDLTKNDSFNEFVSALEFYHTEKVQSVYVKDNYFVFQLEFCVVYYTLCENNVKFSRVGEYNVFVL